MNTIKRWMDAAAVAEQVQLAKEAGTSRGYLYQLSGGFRKVGPSLARRLHAASRKVRTDTTDARKEQGQDPLPLLNKAQMCPEVFGGADE